MKIKVNNYLLKNPKIKKNKTIINISDIHGNIKHINGIIEVIKKIKVDYILMPGDIIDALNQNNQDIFLDKIKELAKYAKVYIALGNHDVLLINKQKTMQVVLTYLYIQD